MTRRKRKQLEFIPRLHIHLREDPIALRQISELILKAIKLADEKAMAEDKRAEGQAGPNDTLAL